MPESKSIGATTLRRDEHGGLGDGLSILECLIKDGSSKTASQLANDLNVSVGRLFRKMKTLERRGYIAKTGKGRQYTIRPKLYELRITAPFFLHLLDEAEDVMATLSEETEQSCNLAIPSADHLTVIAQTIAPGPFSISVPVGFKYDLANSAGGLLLFSFGHNLDRLGYDRRKVSRTEMDLSHLEGKAPEVVSKGFAIAENPRLPDVTDLSCPVFSENTLIAVLTIPYIHTTEGSPLATCLAALQRAVCRLSDGFDGRARVA